MTIIDNIRVANIALIRAAIAIVFLVVTSMQPGFAAAVVDCLSHTAPAATSHALGKASGHDHSAEASALDKAGSPAHSHASGSSLDKDCQVHCSAVQAMPVDHPAPWHPAFVRTYDVVASASLPLGEYEASIRPPRS